MQKMKEQIGLALESFKTARVRANSPEWGGGLHHIMVGMHPDEAQSLVDKRADLQDVDEQGHTFLYHAARFGNATTIKILLDAKADPNEIARRNLFDPATILRMTLDKLFAINKVDATATVLDTLFRDNVVNDERIKALKYLLEAKARPHMNFIERILNSEDPSALKLLLDAKANPNSCDNENCDTWLHKAAEAANPAAIKTLIEAKAKVLASNDFGLTALDIAMSRTPRKPEMERLLASTMQRISGTKALLDAFGKRTGPASVLQKAHESMGIFDPQSLRQVVRFAYEAQDQKKDAKNPSMSEDSVDRVQNELDGTGERAIDGPGARGAAPEPAA